MNKLWIAPRLHATLPLFTPMIFPQKLTIICKYLLTHLPREAHVERPHGRDERRDDERQDERLQHPQEQVADVRDVHNLAVRPAL